jgi:hypothetical protein
MPKGDRDVDRVAVTRRPRFGGVFRKRHVSWLISAENIRDTGRTMITTAKQALDLRSKNNQWLEIYEYFENQAFDRDGDEQSESEIDRALKLRSAISSIFNKLDPDFINGTALSGFDGHISNAHGQFNSYKQAGTIDYIRGMNDALSNAYTALKICLHTTGTEQEQLGSALFENQEMVVKVFRNGAAKIKADARKAHQDLSALNEKIEQINGAHAAIMQLHTVLLSDHDQEKPSVLTSIRAMESAVETQLQKIKGFSDQVFDENTDGGSIKGRILAARKEIDDLKKKADQDIDRLKALIDDIEEFHTLAFGTEAGLEPPIEDVDTADAPTDTNTFASTPPKTIQGKLEWLIQRAEAHKNNTEATTKTLIEQISSLLPRATSAGLASAFESEANKQIIPKLIFTGLFIASLIGMVMAAAPTMIEFIPATVETPRDWKFSKPEGIEAAMRDLLFRLPVIIPCIWMAIFSARRRSECERLQQEYLHKTALAKSYDAYKQQIDNLPEGNEELKKSLLETMLKAISKNASDTLDAKQKPIGLIQSWLASRIIRKIEE